MDNWSAHRGFGLDAHAEGEGKVIFTRTDGAKVVIDNVEVDSVSPLAEIGNVIGLNLFREDRIIHVPFVVSWEFDYRV
jgi:hypothetical protein